MMNETKKIRILQWSIVLLLLCNMGLIVTIWLRPVVSHDRHETPRDFVIRNLKFTDDQVDLYDVLIEAHQRAMRELRQEARGYRQQLFKGLEGGLPQQVNKDSLAVLIGKVQERIETVTYDHFAEVRKICTDAQKPEFDRIIGDVIKKMNGGPPGGPPGHERPGRVEESGHHAPRGEGSPPGEGPPPNE